MNIEEIRPVGPVFRLVKKPVLKRGNALRLVYGIGSDSSADIRDFHRKGLARLTDVV